MPREELRFSGEKMVAETNGKEGRIGYEVLGAALAAFASPP